MQWWKVLLLIAGAVLITAGVSAAIAGAWLLCGASLKLAQGVFWGCVTTFALTTIARASND